MQSSPNWAANPQLTSIVVTLVVVGAILLLRNRRPRPLRLDRLWLRPALAGLAVVYIFAQAPPPLTAASLAALAAALLIGAALGWQRGKFMRIEVDPVTHAATARMSPIGMIFVLALVGLRIWLRQSAAIGATGGLSAAVITDALMLFAGATMAVQQIEVTLRAHRLLAAAKGQP
jgi:hypothetical protein